MVSLVQALTFLFILASLILIILIPILFATNDQTKNSRATVSGLATFWGSLLAATAVANSFL